jgi:hypothetical protein
MLGQAPPSGPPLLATATIVKVGVVIVLMLMFHWFMRNTSVLKTAGKMPWWLVSLVWAGMLILIVLSQGTSKAFIYFQF